MSRTVSKQVLAAVMAGALACGTVATASASPLMSGAMALKESTPSDLLDVRYRGRAGGAVAAGLAIGLIGALAASSARSHYYGPGYYDGYAWPGYSPSYYYGGYYGGYGAYGWPAYRPYYGYAPVYAAPRVVYVQRRVRARCWVQTGPFAGQGYWSRCYR